MKNLLSGIRAFMEEEEGLTAVEYAIAGGLVSAALVAGFGVLGDQACTLMQDLVTAIENGGGPSAGGFTCA